MLASLVNQCIINICNLHPYLEEGQHWRSAGQFPPTRHGSERLSQVSGAQSSCCVSVNVHEGIMIMPRKLG